MELKSRLCSLDVFRGLAIGGMILVNNPGDYEYTYPGLRHAAWHGCTPADLVFPLFLFTVGVSIVLAGNNERDRAKGWWSLGRRIFKRSLILFSLGLLNNGFPNFGLSSMRVPGVLQRIAVVYSLTSLLHKGLSRRAIMGVMVVILLGYWGLMSFVPVPGLGHPSLDKASNLVAWLDTQSMGGHLFEHDPPWDPEGILTTFPAMCITLFGLLAGHLLKDGSRTNGLPMLAWGSLLILAGLIGNAWYSMNKGLSTSSFVVFASGTALVVLALCHWLVDIHGKVGWFKPLLVMGMNSLFIYLYSELLARLSFMIKVTSIVGEQVNLHSFLYEK